MRARLLLASLLMPAAALAAVEVTPQVGYRSGSFEITTGVVCVQSPCPSFAESEDSELYGALVGIPFNDRYQFQLLVNRQPSELTFVETPRGRSNGLAAVDLDVTHVHVGVQRSWRLAAVQPFVAGGVGQTRIEARSPLLGSIDSDRFSGSAAAGALIPLGSDERFGLRLEARGYLVDFPEDRQLGSDYIRAFQSDLTQFETTVGVTFRF